MGLLSIKRLVDDRKAVGSTLLPALIVIGISVYCMQAMVINDRFSWALQPAVVLWVLAYIVYLAGLGYAFMHRRQGVRFAWLVSAWVFSAVAVYLTTFIFSFTYLSAVELSSLWRNFQLEIFIPLVGTSALALGALVGVIYDVKRQS